MLYQLVLRALLFCLLISFFTPTFAQNESKSSSIYMVSFNVLAPCWASPTHYPNEASPYLDRVMRRNHIIDFLTSVADKADIIALQETTQTEFNFFKQALERNFYAFQAYHDPSYWSVWITQDPPWEPNGVAIFVKKSTFTNVNFRDLPLTEDGNHSAYFEGIQESTGLTVRAASVHLDNERAYNRNHELNFLLNYMTPDKSTRDIIMGDFNFGTQGGIIKRYLDKNQFVDTLHYLQKEEWTTPFYEDGKVNYGILDHMVVRNLIPVDGHVDNFGLWKSYPKDETGRIIANLKISGSDHFPVSSIAK
jgi:endonuclease/exonuclease/phosphatase family metal-dependent hydrolase